MRQTHKQRQRQRLVTALSPNYMISEVCNVVQIEKEKPDTCLYYANAATPSKSLYIMTVTMTLRLIKG